MVSEVRIAEFATKVEALGVVVNRVADPAAAAARIAQIAGESDAKAAVMSAELNAAAPGLAPALAAAGVPSTVAGSPDDSRDQPLGLSLTTMAVAETGSVVLAEPTLADRSVGLITRTNVILCLTEHLAASLDDAGERLRELALRPGGAYAALVTGPSRTADIEMSLTVGVQGPARVFVLFVDQLN